jgi:hypothetical protein
MASSFVAGLALVSAPIAVGKFMIGKPPSLGSSCTGRVRCADPTRVPYESARFCSACAGAIPTPGLRLVARTGETCATPTIFFFVGFNLILWTKRLILEEQGIEFSGFFTATVAALLVGKAVLVTDNLPFMRRFDARQWSSPFCSRVPSTGCAY